MATGTPRPKWLSDLSQPIPELVRNPPRGPMTNQTAQQFQTATGYMPNVTVGGNFGVRRPTQLAPAGYDASQRSAALTARMLAPDFNADGRYFQGAQIGVNSRGRPAWIDPAPVGDAADMEARKRAIFERMEQQGSGYFDRKTGRFIGAAGGTATPSPAAMALYGNDQAQRAAAVAGRVPSLRPGTLDPTINGTVGGEPVAAPASPAVTALAPQAAPSGPSGMDAYRQRQARAQEMVTARAQQRAADRRARLAGPDWQEVLAMRNPQWGARMAELNAQERLARQGLDWQRENAQMTDARERYVADQNAAVARENARAALTIRLMEEGVPLDQAQQIAMQGGAGANSPAAQALAPPTVQPPEPARDYFNATTWQQFATLPIEQQRQQLAALSVPPERRRAILAAADPEPGFGMDDLTSIAMGRDKYTGDMTGLYPAAVGLAGSNPVLRWLGVIP